MSRPVIAAIFLALATGSSALAADGAQLFNMQCRMCHTGGPMGPSLVGAAGGPIAAKTFAYSPGLKAKGGTWTDANLDAYLKQPSAFSPGTKMLINVPSAEVRAALIEYLKTLK